MKIGNVKIHFFKPLPLERNQLEGYQTLSVKEYNTLFFIVFVVCCFKNFVNIYSQYLSENGLELMTTLRFLAILFLCIVISFNLHEILHAFPFNHSGDIYLFCSNTDKNKCNKFSVGFICRFVWNGKMNKIAFLIKIIMPFITGLTLMFFSNIYLFLIGLLISAGASNDISKFIYVIRNYNDINILKISKDGEEIYYK